MHKSTFDLKRLGQDLCESLVGFKKQQEALEDKIKEQLLKEEAKRKEE